MKNLLETFQKSLYNPEFYRTVSLAPLSNAFRFYAKITLILSVAMTIVFSILLIPQGVRFIKEEAPALVKKYYPADLVITIKKGEATSNVTEPYIIPAKDGVKEALKGTPTENILVIDTKNDFTKKSFNDYKTFALLTKGEMVTQSNQGRITIQDLSGAPDMVVSQEAILTWVEKVSASLNAFVPAGIILTFIIIAAGFVLYLIPVLLFALVPFFLAWMKKVPLSYSSAYRISLYASLPGLVLKSLLNMGGIFFVPAYLTFLVFLLIIFINMRDVEEPTLFTKN